MDITRNQYWGAGVVLLCIGIQFLFVDSVELTPSFTQFISDRPAQPLAAVGASPLLGATDQGPPKGKVVHLPEWFGWPFISIGAVLASHSLALAKPSG
jgi:hypothetical protein